MRAVVAAIFGLAAASTLSTTPGGTGFHLDGDATPDAKYGCHCHEVSGNGTLVNDPALTHLCCTPKDLHDDGQLCKPLEIDQSIGFLACCVNSGGGHGYGGKCDAIKTHTTVTSNSASPTTTGYPNLRHRDRMFDDKMCTCTGNPTDAEGCCWMFDGLFNRDDQSCQIWDFEDDSYFVRYNACCNGATCSLVDTITAVSTGIVEETGPAKPQRRDSIVTLYPRDPSKTFPQFCVCAGMENSSCCRKASGVFFEPMSCEIDSASNLAEYTDCCHHSHVCVNAPDSASTLATRASIALTWVKPTAAVSATASPTYTPDVTKLDPRDSVPDPLNADDSPYSCRCGGITIGLQWMCCREYSQGIFFGNHCVFDSQDQSDRYLKCCNTEHGMGECERPHPPNGGITRDPTIL